MIAKLEDIDIKQINIHDPYDESDNILKMDLSIEKMQPLMLRLDELSVITITDNNIILDIRNKDNIKTFFTKLDEYIVSILHERKITKKLKIKFNYRQLISTYTGKDTQYDILSLNLNFDDATYNTEVYQSQKNKLNKLDTLHLCKDNTHSECIVELTSLIFDKSNAIIYIDNVIRQMKVKKIKPKRIAKINYSFVDSECSSKCHSDCTSDRASDRASDCTSDCVSESSPKYKLHTDSEKYKNTKTDDDRLVNNTNSDKLTSNNDDNFEDSIDDEILNHLQNDTSDDE
jgi:hypothetical protein